MWPKVGALGVPNMEAEGMDARLRRLIWRPCSGAEPGVPAIDVNLPWRESVAA